MFLMCLGGNILILVYYYTTIRIKSKPKFTVNITAFINPT